MPKNVYFKIIPNLLPKDDSRYIKWRESLKKRKAPWSKGKTKYTDTRVMKISNTFKRKKIDNFAGWRKKAKKSGLIPNSYPAFSKCKDLSCLIGIILGDGHIDRFPRTDKLTITLGNDKPELINFTELLMKKVFNKDPLVRQDSFTNAVRISLYQKYISKRLDIPFGNRRYSKSGIPAWIWGNKNNLTSCLRGLFEAEASFSVHVATYTYNFEFSNLNIVLLDQVQKALILLGFHPERRTDAVRLRRKKEALKFKELISFRIYTLL